VKILFRAVLAGVVLAVVAAALLVSQPILWTRGAREPIAVDPQRLEIHVRRLAQDRPRSLRSPEKLDDAADYIKDSWSRCGLEVSEQDFTADRKRARNLVAALGEDTGDPIVVGAHYDAYGDMPGADDNASGVAALIELGCALRRESPTRRVELVAFTLEEPPYFGSKQMGSWVHAQSLLQRGRRARAMLCLEMVGDFSNERGSQTFPFPALGLIYPTRGNFIAVVGRLKDRSLIRRVKIAMAGVANLRVRSIAAPAAMTGIDLSDHSSYWNAGFPAVMITDTAFYRNARYHTAEDTPETLDYRQMANVVSGVYEAVRALAGPAS